MYVKWLHPANTKNYSVIWGFTVEEISAEQVSVYAETAIELLMSYAPKLILAIVVLILGLWLINRIVRLISKGMERGNTEPTLAKFLGNLVSIGMKALLLICERQATETSEFIVYWKIGDPDPDSLRRVQCLQGHLRNIVIGPAIGLMM